MILIYIAIMIITFYIGGIYRNMPVTVLFIAEAAIFVIMLITVLISRRGISCAFKKDIGCCNKDSRVKREIIFKNNSPFTILRLTYKIRSFYISPKENKAKKYKLSLSRKSSISSQPEIQGKYCGIMHIRAYNVRVRDYFGIFNIKSRAEAKSDLLIIPTEKPLKFKKRMSATDYDRELIEGVLNKGHNSQEIHQLRQYQPGDSFKNIHWNMSARTDELYYKEFKDTESSRVKLFIDLRGKDSTDLNKTDAFYELCSSVILGLLYSLGTTEVQWFNKGRKESMVIKESTGLKSILTRLYYCTTDREIKPHSLYKNEDYFIFNTNLELYNGKSLIYSFSDKEWENQIKVEEFII